MTKPLITDLVAADEGAFQTLRPCLSLPENAAEISEEIARCGFPLLRGRTISGEEAVYIGMFLHRMVLTETRVRFLEGRIREWVARLDDMSRAVAMSQEVARGKIL